MLIYQFLILSPCLLTSRLNCIGILHDKTFYIQMLKNNVKTCSNSKSNWLW